MGAGTVSDDFLRQLLPDLHEIQSDADCGHARADRPFVCAKGPPTRSHMVRYIVAFSLLFLLGGVACAAAMAASAPAFGQIAFLVCLGLFVAALADGVVERQSSRHK